MTNHGLLKTKARGILLMTYVGPQGAETDQCTGLTAASCLAAARKGVKAVKGQGLDGGTRPGQQQLLSCTPPLII